jgi:putative ABC transport system permease protein
MERELDAELAFHLDMLAAQHEARGLSPAAARRAARQAFGGVDQIKDHVRDTWLTRVVETIGQDVRYGLRGLRQQLGYAIAVVVTMALGVGANSAIFSVVNATVLQPLPYHRGEDLVLLRQTRTGIENTGFSMKDINDIKTLTTTLDAIVEYHNMYFILLGGWEPSRVSTGVVSWDYFDTLGIRPMLGRTFTESEDQPDATPTLVIGYEYWQRAFKGNPSIIGRQFQMNDRRYTVIGVLPNLPMYPQVHDVYMTRTACPFRMSAGEQARRGSGMANAFARRKSNVTIEETQADLDAIAVHLQKTDPDDYRSDQGHGLIATPLRREFTRAFESTLVMLLATAGFVLLIVVASVANLSLARTARRDRELALRTALGASSARLLRQLLTENVVLSVIGCAAGLLLAFGGMALLITYVERFTPRASEIRMDRAVLLFTLAISIVTGLAAGLTPLVSRRLAGYPGNRASTSRKRLRRALIVAQVAASFVLLIGAGLTLRSLVKLTHVDPGFTTDHVLTMQIDMNFTKYHTTYERSEYLNRLLVALQGVPGVVEVGASGSIPFLEGAGRGFDEFFVEGRPVTTGERLPRAAVKLASEDYFRAMRIPLVTGRFFQPSDDLGASPVVIVNQSMAERHWPGGNAVGQRVSGDGVHWRTIVGVVPNVRQQLALEPTDEVYLPMRQQPYVTTMWVIRATADLDRLAPHVRDAVYAVDRDQPIYRMRSLDDVRDASLTPPKLTTTLLGLFAGLALLITASGIGGVVAFSVSQRTQEFGVRVAFGAKRTDVVSMVLVEGVYLALRGLAIGVIGALVLGSVLSTLLFGVQPTDIVTYVSVSSLLLTVAALACLLPALRAASVDPIEALRAT